MDELVDVIKSSVIAQVVGILVGALVGAWVLTRVLRFAIVQVTRRTAVTWDDHLAAQLAGPLSASIAIQVFACASSGWSSTRGRSRHCRK